MTNQELFESIKNNHEEKIISSLCNKLIKKCSFNSGSDIQNLCHLAYWLFVFGYDEDVLLLCEITHDVAFPGKGGFNVWDFVLYIWGLEVHILKQKNCFDKANERIKKMDEIWLMPPQKSEHERARRNGVTISHCSREKEIATTTSADKWRFIALFKLIGYGSTGLFPNLNNQQSVVDELVKEYIQILKQGKTRK